MARVKISFPISSEYGAVERMFAQHTADNRYVLDNSPFYAFDISFCDEFFVKEVNGEKVFSGLASRGGHSTYRIKLPKNKDHEYFLNYWEPLKELGCSFEGSSANERRLYSIDMPPDVNVHKAYQVMESLEDEGIWEFEEGHYYSASMQ
ncbi:hypothetical protein GCM10007877_32990 [Marinibactrum halimedae]|uniref:DUF4265 domain-containing protein n=2 Tax=Marinibactrum halimedae TaxID=1444977 RepID=A0AA37TDB2_9GAMM|nr:hypothetical protein GCM10007877_32990 [Marinibactrum halimedae]